MKMKRKQKSFFIMATIAATIAMTYTNNAKESNLLLDNVEALSQDAGDSPQSSGGGTEYMKGYVRGRYLWTSGDGDMDDTETYEFDIAATATPLSELSGGWKLLSAIASQIGGNIHVVYTRTVKKPAYQDYHRLACLPVEDPESLCPVSRTYSKAVKDGNRYTGEPTYSGIVSQEG